MILPSARFSFAAKLAAAAALVALFDWLFLWHGGGSTIGAFAFGCLVAMLLVRGGLRRSPLALVFAGAAAIFASALVWDPSLLAWAMFWGALSIAALLPRTAGFDDAWRWTLRLTIHVLAGWLAALIDLRRLVMVRRRGRLRDLRAWVALLGVPLIGTALFTTLFASANPLIASAFASIALPDPASTAISALVVIGIWPSLRPARFVTRLVAELPPGEMRIQEASLPSVLIALIAFNLLFALENGLDIAYLWSGASLPAGTTLAGYAHQGAYPLIVTALLAGLFVLMLLRPGTASAASPVARRLVVLWVAQNLFLVASSALRTIDYVEAYSMTRLRLAALIWMGLVALGLALICWRLIRGLSARWLINANALAATTVLGACCFIDLGSIAAAWNVTHAREVGGDGSPLDLCYLGELRASALVPLAQLERSATSPAFRLRVRRVREEIMAGAWGEMSGLRAAQADWHTRIWRSDARIADARALIGPGFDRAIASADITWNCNGRPNPQTQPAPAPAQTSPAPPPPIPTTPLTKAPTR